MTDPAGPDDAPDSADPSADGAARDAAFEAQRTSFGGAAEVYDRARPSYPDASVDWLTASLDPAVLGRAPRVLDLGAGTGKLTRALLARGFEVVAVDPAEGMLRRLAASLPQVEVRVGVAEQLPLERGEVDLVVAAQTWHWVDESRALPEVARVLRPGGELGLVWNIRDEGVPWVARMGAAMGHSAAERRMQHEIAIGAPFGPTATHAETWSRELDLAELLDLVRSRSYVITASDADRERILSDVADAVVAEFGSEAATGARFRLPYSTHAFRAALAG
jgi:SAM-dependent methyltransferase